MRFFTVIFAICIASTSFAADNVDVISRLLRVPIPETMELGGDRVPLEREDVRERLELELMVILGNPVQTGLWIKRVPRFFPEVEAQLARMELPDDLKYISVVESNLRADALSRAGAAGPWQFMRSTGRMQGLEQNRSRDERRDWSKATDAALRYLIELHGDFNDWPLALAAYNAGKGRVRGAMRDQEQQDYWGLKLPTETERYVFRVLAAKLVLEHPERYGIEMADGFLYEPLATTDVSLQVRRRRMPVSALARSAGVSYRYLLQLNPWLTGAELPKGSYLLKVPVDEAAGFAERLAGWKADNPEPTMVSYRVKKGDTLIRIARDHEVSLTAILATNGLSRRSIIRPGQKLLVPLDE